MKKLISISIIFFAININSLSCMNQLTLSFNEASLPSRKEKKPPTKINRLESSSNILPGDDDKYIIILKGAPSTGKSKVLEALKDSFESKKVKYEIEYVKETATEIIKELQKKDKPFNLKNFLSERKNLYWFQTKIIKRQLKKELEAIKKKKIIILDRSLIDIKAYISIYFKDELKYIKTKQSTELEDYEKKFIAALNLLENAISQKHKNYHYLIISFESKKPTNFEEFNDSNRAESNSEEINRISELLNKKYSKYLENDTESDTEVSSEIPYIPNNKKTITKKRISVQKEVERFIQNRNKN